MRLLPLACLLTLPLLAITAQAAVTHADAASLQIEHRIIVHTDAPTSFEGLRHIERWWSGEHTYSGDASRLKLDARAGGCWCEVWAEGEIEHGRVLYLKRDAQLRIDGALGPLQGLAVNAVLDFSLTQGKDGTQIDLVYRVNGSAASKLDTLAPVIDKVLGEQLQRLQAHLEPQAPNAGG